MGWNTKRTIALAAVCMMTAASGMTALAASLKDQKSTEIEYQVSSGYEWMIHDKVSFGSNLGVNQKKEVTTDQNNSVRVTKNVIPGNTKLQITVSSDTVKDNKYVISNGSKELYYTIRKAGDAAEIIPGGAVLEVKNGTNSASQPLVFTLDTGSAETEEAGYYTGRVTYTAAVVSQ